LRWINSDCAQTIAVEAKPSQRWVDHIPMLDNQHAGPPLEHDADHGNANESRGIEPQ
jgi:hypothetical protein